MKNELGIEKKCENCHFCYGSICDNGYYCRREKGNPKKDFKSFTPSFQAYKSRIIELQEQQFTNEELQFIKDRLDECIEEWNVPDMVFMAHKILKKIEQTLKNSAENLNKQQ